MDYALETARAFVVAHQADMSLATAAAAVAALVLSIYNTFRWKSSTRARRALLDANQRIDRLEDLWQRMLLNASNRPLSE